MRSNTDIGKKQPPLLLYPGTLQTIRTTAGHTGLITAQHGAGIQLCCPGRGNYVKNSGDDHQLNELHIRCATGTKFTDANGETIGMQRLQCARWPEHSIRPNGTCLWGHKRLVTGFDVSAGFVPVYESCFDAAAARTIYTKIRLTNDAQSAQRGVKRPSWRGREQYDFDPGVFYTKKHQYRTFVQLLGSEELASRYVHVGGRADGDENDDDAGGDQQAFLSRGHLAAKSDFLQGAVQAATFRYTNAAPQWQAFNGGNWNALENDVRAFVQRRGADVWCYTGTYGTATASDVRGNEVPLALGPNGTLPVPLVFWKVLYAEPEQRGIAFVGVNDPYQSVAKARELIRCRDICDRLTWRLSWRRSDVKRGFAFCCEVNDFRTNFGGVLPEFTVIGTLMTD